MSAPAPLLRCLSERSWKNGAQTALGTVPPTSLGVQPLQDDTAVGPRGQGLLTCCSLSSPRPPGYLSGILTMAGARG